MPIHLYEARSDSVGPTVPYPISGHSAISEIHAGVDLYGTLVRPCADWLAGAVEIAEHALWFLQDATACRQDYHHPDRSLPDLRRTWERNPEFLARKLAGESIEEFAERLWQEHQAKSVEFLNAFLAAHRV